MSPLFHATQLSAYAGTMRAVAEHALARMRDGESIDLAHELTRITMSVVAATLFGADTSEEADDVGHALTVALKWVDSALATPQLTLQVMLIEAMEKARPRVPRAFAIVRQRIEEALREPFLLPGRRGSELARAIRTLDARMTAMIDDRRAKPNERADCSRACSWRATPTAAMATARGMATAMATVTAAE